MANRAQELAALGWNDWFEEQASRHCEPSESVAKVVAVDREQSLLVDETGVFRAKLSGTYRYRLHDAESLPCVGDWVWVERDRRDDFGLILSLLERKTTLCRKAPGSARAVQVIAANLDYVFIVQSCHFDFNVKRLERYLVMATEGGVEPHVLLTKTDLVDESVLSAQVAEIRSAGITAPISTMSNVTRTGIDALKALLQPGKTYCLVGSSGVGKSTLINELIGRDRLETGNVSATGEGRHTTVRRELVILANGAMVIDNPGMREFGIANAEAGIEAHFSNIVESAAECRYRDCTHTNEPGCAIRNAVEAGGDRRRPL
ncbi:MAG: ribosome small subunit-dependent GTPase A [Polyangiaceae bacterium]